VFVRLTAGLLTAEPALEPAAVPVPVPVVLVPVVLLPVPAPVPTTGGGAMYTGLIYALWATCVIIGADMVPGAIVRLKKQWAEKTQE
jgi:hypothetical protein